ncbi:hypothetical protein AB0J83_22595 [Actinoplanes sp. NPDC049596]|uniref:hypothetical protein n=1 Tax=unclassified Actinoplanes TaxID=2626549 RepID=UPI0034371315
MTRGFQVTNSSWDGYRLIAVWHPYCEIVRDGGETVAEFALSDSLVTTYVDIRR